MKRAKGFTLIELLVVLAIIAILTAIIFPVFSAARRNAYFSSDISSLDQIRTALQLYHVDQGAYPPALLGYATQYSGGPNPVIGDVIPANLVVGPLYPKRIPSLSILQPSQDEINGPTANTEFTTAVWPNRQGPGGAGQPQQRFGPNDGFVQRCYDPTDGTAPFDVDNYYYNISGYDVANIPTLSGGRNEIHYTLFWTGWTVPADPCNPNPNTESGSVTDNPRQLGYSDPPDTTVVTWDSFFRSYDANDAPLRQKSDIVLFLGGSAKAYDSLDVFNESWAIQP